MTEKNVIWISHHEQKTLRLLEIDIHGNKDMKTYKVNDKSISDLMSYPILDVESK
jgi:hypothetical protein